MELVFQDRGRQNQVEVLRLLHSLSSRRQILLLLLVSVPAAAQRGEHLQTITPVQTHIALH